MQQGTSQILPDFSVLLSQIGGGLEGKECLVRPIQGGANNRVFFVRVGEAEYLLKSYFFSGGDRRDRYAAELQFYKYAHGVAKAKRIARPCGWDVGRRQAAFEYVRDHRPEGFQVGAAEVESALCFFAEINGARQGAEGLGLASEACFAPEEHFAAVDRRLQRLGETGFLEAEDWEAKGFWESELMPAWERFRGEATGREEELLRLLNDGQRCLSPSDFGYHNASLRAGGEWVFFDFEYAGWDDPAKLVCDFFCQPEYPVPGEFLPFFAKRVGEILGLSKVGNFVQYCGLLCPVYRFKWCCILLNEFLSVDAARRNFSGKTPDVQRKKMQLEKAKKMLQFKNHI